MINWEGKDKDLLALIKYIAEEDKLEKVLENPQVIKTPVVRNGKTIHSWISALKAWNEKWFLDEKASKDCDNKKDGIPDSISP